jgi:phospholipase/carboxylesterase
MNFVHRFKPAAEGDRRTLLILHGTGGDEQSLLPLGEAIAPTAGLLSPRGKVSESGAKGFFRRFAEGVFDYDDIRARAHELAQFVADAVARYSLDPTQVYAAGYSNGANMGWSTMLLHPELFKGAVLLRSMTTLKDVAPDLTGKQIFLAAGREDPIVPIQDVEAVVEQMRSLGAEVDFHVSPLGHQLSRPEIDLAKTWLDRVSL